MGGFRLRCRRGTGYRGVIRRGCDGGRQGGADEGAIEFHFAGREVVKAADDIEGLAVVEFAENGAAFPDLADGEDHVEPADIVDKFQVL